MKEIKVEKGISYEDLVSNLNSRKKEIESVINISYDPLTCNWLAFLYENETAIDIKTLLGIIRSEKNSDMYFYRDMNNQYVVTSEWLVGGFAGRSFTGYTEEEALRELCVYFNRELESGKDSLVKRVLVDFGWPNLMEVMNYISERNHEK